MNRTTRLAVVTWIAAGALGATLGGAADLEMTILKPDGKPAANVAVEVASAERTHGQEESPRVKSTTDNQGLARFAWPEGVWRMDVRVAGVGHTATGLVEVLASRENTAPLPALAPFARLAGTLPPAARVENAVVKIRGSFAWDEEIVVRPIDGRFSVELPSGTYGEVFVSEGKKRLAEGGGIVVAPGETIANVPFKPVAPVDQRGHAIHMERPGHDQTLAWVKGTVRDETGKPVKGTTVYACATYDGGMRMYEIVRKAVSDEQGRYEIQGEGGLVAFSASLVAHVPGRPNAWSWFSRNDFGGGWVEVDTKDPPKKVKEAPRIDITIPSLGGTLELKIERDGKPASGVSVRVSLEGVNLRDIWAKGHGDEQLTAIVEPVTKTGEDGVARFENLLPGTYEVIATAGQDPPTRRMRGLWMNESVIAKGTATGVSVRVAHTTTHRMTIYPQRNQVEAQVLKVNGEPLTGGGIGFEYGPVTGGGWSTGLSLDSHGRGRMGFESAGLWRVEYKYRESPVKWIPIREPYSAAQAVVAVSSLLDPKEPVRMRAIRFEPGTIVAELKDVNGKPLRGTVELDRGVGDRIAIGSTNAGGAVRFAGVPDGKYVLRAHVPELSLPDLDVPDQPVPAERLLRNRQAVPWAPVEPRFNTEQRVVLQVREAGYVLGVLRPARGKKTSDYLVYLDDGLKEQGANIGYRPATGEFVAGPFAPGKVKLTAWDHTDPTQPVACGDAEATVEPGKVTRAEIASSAKAVKPLAQDGFVMLGIGGMSALGRGAEKLAGRVLLPDGKTPALAARVMYFEPKQWEARLAGMTDASGTLHARGVWYSKNATDGRPPEYPDQPVTVAWLPGCYGAVIRPVREEKVMQWVLPEAKVLRGTVRVGGKPPGARGQILILAAYQGKGALSGILSVETTAQADGSFELHGLTDGTYKVQAALDRIWLSGALEVNVDRNDPRPATLEIGAPAGPVVTKLVGADGRALCGRAVALERPAGPLDALWPRILLSDGAGEVHVPALEAGLHKLRVVGTAVEREIKVDALPARQHGEERIEVK